MRNVFALDFRIKSDIILKIIIGSYLLLAGLSQFEAHQIDEKTYKIVHDIMPSMFAQKWTMFAPNPLSFSQQIQFQCRKNESNRIWLEDIKFEHSIMASITRQKLIFYFEDYVSALNAEIESLQSRGIRNIANYFATYSMSLPAVQNLATLLARECGGHVPDTVEFVKIWIDTSKVERFKLWGN